jgi:hypothetical protein
MYENPRISGPEYPHLRVVFEAAASRFVSTLFAFGTAYPLE